MDQYSVLFQKTFKIISCEEELKEKGDVDF